MTVFQGRIVVPDGIVPDGQMVVEDGRIVDVRRGGRIPRNAMVADAGGGWIVPGYLFTCVGCL